MRLALVAVACVVAGSVGAAVTAPTRVVVDTHVHFANLSKLEYQGDWVTKMRNGRSYLPEDYAADVGSSSLPAATVVFQQAAVVVNQSIDEVLWVQSLAVSARPVFLCSWTGRRPDLPWTPAPRPHCPPLFGSVPAPNHHRATRRHR